MRKLFLFLLFSFTLSASNAVSASDYLKMMNSYTSVKLHLDSDPNRGQMVGAAWLRIRNNTDAPITQVPFILNPGLQVTKALGSNNMPLANRSETTNIAGYEFLEATVGTITLAAPVKPDSDTEVVIHYRGSLQNLSWAGVEHAKETLDSQFTVLRADSLGYPVIAAPTKASLQAALKQPPYYQTATVELADGYTIAGNLHVDETSIKGANKSYGLRHAQPTAPMILPIARYHKTESGPLTVSVFNGEQNAASEIVSALSPSLAQLNTLLGAPTAGKLNVTMVPDGYGTANTMGLAMLERSNFSADTIQTSGALLKLWGIGAPHAAGRWQNSLDGIIQTVVSGNSLEAHADAAFKSVHARKKDLAKATLESLSEAQAHTDAEALSSIVLTGLYNLMGHDSFFEFVRKLRADLRGNYADNIAFVEFLAEELQHKKAKKFAKNWLSGKKIGKDMKKADSFNALMARYK